MIDPKWEFFDNVALRAFPNLSRSHRSDRLNTAALVADILEDKGRFTCSPELMERVRLAARDVEEEEKKV